MPPIRNPEIRPERLNQGVTANFNLFIATVAVMGHSANVN